MPIVQLLGSLAGLCFAYCGVPTACSVFKAKETPQGIGKTAVMIALGGILMWSYLYIMYGWNWILTVNYTVEVASWLIVVYYWKWPKNAKV